MKIQLINIPSMPAVIRKFYCSPGERKKPLYKYEFDPAYGCPRRVKSGEMDIQDFIQQSADDVDFKAIGKMLVDTRDNVAGHFNLEGEIMDVTKLPRNIHEYEALHNKMLAEFEGLPAGVKSLFNNDFNLFSSAWKSGTIGSTLDTYYKSLSAPASPTDTTPKEGE